MSVTASFTRATSATKINGSTVTSGNPRYETGKFGNAIMVEEGTTNVLLYSNAFNNSTFWSLFTFAGTGTAPVVTAGLTDPLGGTNAFRIQANIAAGTTSSDYSLLRNTMASAAYTRSIWIKSNTGSPQTITLAAGQVTSNVVATTTWTRVSVYQALAGAYFDIGTQGHIGTTKTVDVLVWQAQCEAKGYATSYVPTTTATDFRNDEILSITTADVVNANEGSVAMWVKVNNTAKTSARLIQSTLDGSNYFCVNVAYAAFVVATVYTTLTMTTIGDGNWHHVAITWSATGKKLYRNGALAQSTTDTQAVKLGTTIGQVSPSVNFILNGLIENLRFYQTALTATEVATLYGETA